MDLRQLEMFLAVAEHNSFTRASQQLYVAQSAISRKIRMLEEELGSPIFKRVNRRISLTPPGEVLLRYARKVFSDLRHAQIEFSEIGQLTRGRMRIGADITACMYILPPAFERFLELYPKMEVQVITTTTQNLLKEIRDNSIDLAVLPLPVHFPDLQVLALGKEEMVAVCSKRDPELSHKDTMLAAELENYRFILIQKGTDTREWLDVFFARKNIKPRISIEMEHINAIKTLVEVGLGISIIPLPALIPESQHGNLHYIRIRDYDLTREIGVVYCKTDPIPTALDTLVKIFKMTNPLCATSAFTQASRVRVVA